LYWVKERPNIFLFKGLEATNPINASLITLLTRLFTTVDAEPAIALSAWMAQCIGDLMIISWIFWSTRFQK
jgi:hypothetical protein